jgi:hypothetical protein
MTRADDVATTSQTDASILTCSFRGDFEICSMLCESIDRFVPETIKHKLYVPEADLNLFQPLANARRSVISEDTLLPKWFWKIPLPDAHWRRRLFLPRRNFYLTPFSMPVRGWIVQQIMKIAAAAGSSTEIVLHVDSDALFVRPFSVDQLFHDEAHARLFRRAPEAGKGHRSWHLAASKLLGLPPDEFHDGDYIDSLVVWRRSVVRKMIERIEQTGKRNWQIILGRTPHFSEYVLYGVFAERVLGLADAKLAIEQISLCHSRWSGEFSSAEDENDFVTSIDPKMVGFCIQSTIALSLPERRDLYERMISFAELQDRSGLNPAANDATCRGYENLPSQ